MAGYLAQLQPLPKDLCKRETFFAHAILHLPQNTFTLEALFNLSLAGGPKIGSLVVMSRAAATRAAMRASALANM